MLQIVVIAHGQGIAAFNRHRKYWETFKAPILVVDPVNDPVDTDLPRLTIGNAEHNGHQSIIRLKALFEVLHQKPWEHCFIYEYDSFSLCPSMPGTSGLFGNLYANKESPKFTAPIYANPPWFFDRESFEAMRNVATTFPVFEHGEADRWISALAYLAGVPLFDYDSKGFSRGTINEKDIAKLRKVIKEDRCIHIHGVKQKWVLAAIEQFYDEANPTKGNQ